MTLEEKIKCMERVDMLIKLKATGPPKKMSSRLEISESSLYQLLNKMKKLGAPIFYSFAHQSYCYKYDVTFSFGFKPVEKAS